MKKVRFSAAALAALMLLAGCAQTASEPEETTTAAVESETAESESSRELAADDLPPLDYEGMDFSIYTVSNPNFHADTVIHEMTGETYNDSLYERTLKVEEKLNINLVETLVDDGEVPSKMQNSVMSGDGAFSFFSMRCDHALPFWQKKSIITWDSMPHVNLDKPYWDKSLNESLSLGGQQCMSIGAYNITTYDLAYVLLFNKELLADLKLEDPYTLVREGKWTFDKMDAMMAAAKSDLNGDGKMNAKDRFGYVAHTKMITPDFWIAAGVKSIEKDADDIPYFAMGSDRFLEVWEKIFVMMYDHENWWSGASYDADVPTSSIKMFTAGQALFMDTSLYAIESLREMEADFGILPYPKYDEAQTRYYSRVSYYCPSLVPATCPDPDMTGAVMEALMCESYNTVIPAYYDIMLKSRNSRDEESQEMLDLIFGSFVIDIGDTTMCAYIRDNFVATMMGNNSRDFASTVAKNEKVIAKQLEKLLNQ